LSCFVRFVFCCARSVFLHCFYIVVCIVSPFVYSCPPLISVQVYRPLPPGGHAIAVNKYRLLSYQKRVSQSPVKYELKSLLQSVTNPSRDFKRCIWTTDFDRRFNSVACEAYGSFLFVMSPECLPLHRPADSVLPTLRTSISHCTVH